MSKEKPRVVFLTDDKGGCMYYRGWMPMAHLSDRGLIHGSVTNTLPDYAFLHGSSDERKVDVIGIQRPMSSKVCEVIERWKPLIYIDLDDNFFDLGPLNPCWHDIEPYKQKIGNDPLESMKRVLRDAFTVTVSTPQMAEALSLHCGRPVSNTHVIPNAVYQVVSREEIAKQRHGMLRERPLTIGWWGGAHHYEDFIGLDHQLAEFVKRHKENVNFVCMGWAPSELIETGKVTMFPWAKINRFYKTLFSLELDVCLGPLVKNAFSVCKSNIKYLETGMFARTFVGYNHPVFANVKNGETGFLTDGPDELVEVLEDLVAHPEKTVDIGKAAYLDVMHNHLIEHREDLWMKTFEDVLYLGEKWQYTLPEAEHNEFIEKILPQQKELLGIDEILEDKSSLGEPDRLMTMRKFRRK